MCRLLSSSMQIFVSELRLVNPKLETVLVKRTGTYFNWRYGVEGVHGMTLLLSIRKYPDDIPDSLDYIHFEPHVEDRPTVFTINNDNK